MACGLPHRMRFRAFTMRYRCIGPLRRLKKVDDKSSAEDCKVSATIEFVKLLVY